MTESRMVFYGFKPYENGSMAQMTTTGEVEIPVNVYAEPGTDMLMPRGTLCEFALQGIANERSIKVFSRKEDYLRSDIRIACPGMIPVGVFATEEEEREGSFCEVPTVVFSGVVKSVEVLDPMPYRPAFFAEIQTLDLTINLYYDYDKAVRPGDLFFCEAWLFGDITRKNDGRTSGNGGTAKNT